MKWILQQRCNFFNYFQLSELCMVNYNVFCSSISKLMRRPRKRTINGSLLCEIRLDTEAIEIYKFFQSIFPILSLMKIIILTHVPYDHGSRNKLCCKNSKTVNHGTETTS